MAKKGRPECKAFVHKKPNIWKRFWNAHNVPDIDGHNQPWQHDPALAHVPGNRSREAYLAAGNLNLGLVLGSGSGGGNGGATGRGPASGTGGHGGGGEFVAFANPDMDNNWTGVAPDSNRVPSMPKVMDGTSSATTISKPGPLARRSEITRANTLGGQTQARQPLRGYTTENPQDSKASSRTDMYYGSGGGDTVGGRTGRARLTRHASTNARSRQEIPSPGHVSAPGNAHQEDGPSRRNLRSRHTVGESTLAPSHREVSRHSTLPYIPEHQETLHQQYTMASQYAMTNRALTATGSRSIQESSVHVWIPTASNASQNSIQNRGTRASAVSTVVDQRTNREYHLRNPINNTVQGMAYLSTIQEGSELSRSRTQTAIRVLQPESSATQNPNVYLSSEASTVWSQNGPQARASEMVRAGAMDGATQLGVPLRGYEVDHSVNSRRTRRARRTRGSRGSHMDR